MTESAQGEVMKRDVASTWLSPSPSPLPTPLVPPSLCCYVVRKPKQSHGEAQVRVNSQQSGLGSQPTAS